jgi:arylsulfatase A-like enzyme
LLQAIDKAGIKSKSAIIMSADHGGHDKTHGTTQDADMIIPWVAWGAGIKARHAIKGAVSTTDTAATALSLLGLAVPSGWDGKPVREAMR